MIGYVLALAIGLSLGRLGGEDFGRLPMKTAVGMSPFVFAMSTAAGAFVYFPFGMASFVLFENRTVIAPPFAALRPSATGAR